MDFSHNVRTDRYHRPNGALPGDGFFDQTDLMFSFVNRRPDVDFPSHSSLRAANPNTQGQGEHYLQRGFYAAAPYHTQESMTPVTQSHPDDVNLGYQGHMHSFKFQGPDMSLGAVTPGVPRPAGQYGNMAIRYHPQESYSELFSHTFLESQGPDVDNESIVSGTTDCDSNCDLADPCTQEECADQPDACTDRLCPEKTCPDSNCPEKMPAEVVVAAATLAAFGGFDPPSQAADDLSHRAEGHGLHSTHHGCFDGIFGMDASFNPLDIVKHIGMSHVDPVSSNCTTNCPIDDPEIFQHFQYCPLPTFDFDLSDLSNLNNPFSLNAYGTEGTFNFLSHSHEGCGAEIPNPEALVEHLNTQHRNVFQNVLAQGTGYGAAAIDQLSSSRTLSSSSSNTLDATLSSATPSPLRGPFPPTPLSLSQDERSKSLDHASRSSTVSQPSTGEPEQQQCLWCNPTSGQPCGQVFHNSETLFAHVNGEHIQKLEKCGQGFLCHWENCKRRGDGKEGFPQRSKIERHMHTHIGRKPFACDICGQRFSAQQALMQHGLIHSDEKPLRCDWEGCGKTFRQQSALTMHRRIHTGDKPLKCPVCGKAFSESSNLSKHKRIHETKGRYSCPEPGCNKNFHRHDQLRRHMKLHSGSGTEERKDGAAGLDDLMGGMPIDGEGEEVREPLKKKRVR